VDELTESVERYLADHARGYSVDELCKTLNMKKRKLLPILHKLHRMGLVELAYREDKLYVMHIAWRKKRATTN